MTTHYLIYNDARYGPYATSDALFADLAALVMRETQTTPARWLTARTDDAEPANDEVEGEVMIEAIIATNRRTVVKRAGVWYDVALDGAETRAEDNLAHMENLIDLNQKSNRMDDTKTGVGWVRTRYADSSRILVWGVIFVFGQEAE